MKSTTLLPLLAAMVIAIVVTLLFGFNWYIACVMFLLGTLSGIVTRRLERLRREG